MGRPSRRPERSSAGDATAAAAAAPGAREAVALPWGMATQEMQPSSLAALTDDKLARFVIGQQKKTKFEKDREEREAKKRQADEEAAQIYAKFVASFENEDETLGKAFVRGESAGGSGGARSESQRGEVYRLKPSESAPTSSSSSSASGAPLGGPKRSEMARMLDEIKQKDAERQQRRDQLSAAFGAPESSSAGPVKKKRREIDQFLEELKEREPTVPTADEMGITKGSYDHGDPTTTNLYVGNLAPTVTEEALEALFRKYGDVYSVKIMWPRTEEERARKRNCGFVSFFDRSDADDARVSLHDRELEGHAMVVNWGKAVKIDHSLRRPAAKAPATGAAPPPVVPTERPTAGAPQPPQIVVEIPADAVVRARIDRLAQYVATDGVQFEHAVKLRETPQSEAFAFLFDSHSPLATYYRWRVYAFAMGDDAHSWRDGPFQMTVNGAVWVPPPVPPSRRKRPRSTSRSRRSDSGRRARTRSSSSRSVSASRSRSPSRGRSHSSSHVRSRHSRSRSRRSRSSSSRSRSVSPRRRRSRSRRRYSRSRSRDRHRRSRSPDTRSPRRHRRSDRRRRSRSRSSSSRSASRSQSRGRRSRDRSRERTSRSSRDRDPARATPAKEPARLLTGQQIARARDIERGREPNRLADAEYEELQELLASLTLEREAVKQTMGFCLDHSEAAVDIVNVIYRAFAQPEATAGALVAYLYVTSDILHNSSAAVKNASLFRTTFQARLPDMLDRLRVAQRALTGRMSANAMKDKVLAVLTAWESWSLFPPMFLVGLNATFLRRVDEREYEAAHGVADVRDASVDEERLRKACQQAGIRSSGTVPQLLARLQWLREFTSPTAPAAAPASTARGSDSATGAAPADAVALTPSHPVEHAASDATDQEPMGRTRGDGTADADEELDGDPIDDELDGEPLDEDDGAANGKSRRGDEDEDVDGEPMDEDDLDGEPLDDAPLDKSRGAEDNNNDDDLDGAPLDDDDDLDGEPM